MSQTGSTFEQLVKRSIKAQADQGLRLPQRSPRVTGAVGPGGTIRGKVTGIDSLDFEGDFNGTAVYLDAKSTKNTSSFPLANIEQHQVVIVKNAHARGCVAFFLIEFSADGDVRALTWPVLKPWWDAKDYGGRRSIPRSVITRECLQVQTVVRSHNLDLVGLIALLQAQAVPA